MIGLCCLSRLISQFHNLILPFLQDCFVKYKRWIKWQKADKNISISLFFMSSRNCESQISFIIQNKMCFLTARKQTFILLHIVGVYFGKAVTSSSRLSHQKSLRKIVNGQPISCRKQHITRWKHSPVYVRVCALVLSLEYFQYDPRLTVCVEWCECCTSNRMSGLHQPVCCMCVWFLYSC